VSLHRARFAAVALLAALLAIAVVSFARLPARAAAAAPAMGAHGMVVTAEAHATAAGVEMLESGGNAIDAAVAAAFVLGVTEPYHSGIGSGGFLLARFADGRTVALDMRETAPARATRDMFVAPGVPEDASRLGPLSVATPGLVAGLTEALARWGTKPLPEVMAPAIRLAEQGFPISLRHAQVLALVRQMGMAQRFPETARIQLPPDGQTPQPGWVLRQPDLARTLRTIAREGPDAFYRGAIAKQIAAEMERQGGLVSLDDLDSYRTKLREPLHGSYRGLDVISFPPPSSGGVALIEMLQMLEGFDLASRGAGSSASIHVIAESMKLAFADRAHLLGDPDFVDVPVAALVDPAYAARQRARIDPPWWKRAPWTWGDAEVAIEVDGPGLPANDGGTTHLSVTDAAGNAVSLTQTLNLLFGSGITVPGTGIVLNDQMDDFSVAPNKPNAFGLVDVRGTNAVGPGKRPLSSMTPTIVLKDGKTFLVTGSPGGPRIITTVLLSILNVVDYGMTIEEAVSAPRFHHQWVPDVLTIERAIPEDVREGLRRRGHGIEVSPRDWSSAEAIEIDPATGVHLGGCDPRSDGLALGVP
jgi:gamma-glutamyltranspeptidase/glutathione hydrolase